MVNWPTFDELNVLNKQSDDSSAGRGGADSITPDFDVFCGESIP